MKKRRDHSNERTEALERIEQLFRRAEELIAVEIDVATKISEEVRDLALSLAEKGLEGRALDLLGECYARSGRYAEAIEVMERAIPLLEESGEFRRAMVVNTNIGNTHWFVGEHEKSLARFVESRERARSVEDREHLLIATNNIGNALIHLGRLSEAEAELNDSLLLGRELEDQRMIASTLHNLGRVQLDRRDYRTGLATLEEGLEIFREIEYRPGISAISITLGRSYEELGNPVAALESYNRSITVSRAIGDRRSEAGVLNNVGTIYQNENRLEEAAEHFRLSLALKEKLGNQHDLANTLHNLAKLALEQEDRERASRYFEQIHEIALQEEAPFLLARALLGRVRVALLRGDSSLQVEESLERARRSIEEIELPVQRSESLVELGEIEIAIGEVTRATERLNRILAEPATKEREELVGRLHGLLALAHRLSGDLALACDHLEAQRRIERLLARRNADNRLESQMAIYEVDRARTESAIARKEAEILRLEKKRLEEEVEHRQRELLSSAMFLSQKNDFLRTLRERLEKIDATDHLGSITNEIDGIVETESSWDRFEGEFRKVHGDYLQVVASRYPKLTPTELKVCALVRTGLSTKEIARILITEPRSIDKYRQRTRKKIGLDSSENLQVFLQGINVSDPE